MNVFYHLNNQFLIFEIYYLDKIILKILNKSVPNIHLTCNPRCIAPETSFQITLLELKLNSKNERINFL